mgnify:CR=1 FL=1
MAITALTAQFFGGSSGSSATQGLGADLLTAIAQAKNPLNAAALTSTSNKPVIKAPWESAATSTPATTLVKNALSGKAFFDASTKKFSTPGLSDDARDLFALHAGINTLSALSGRYDQDGVSDSEKKRLADAFAKGMKQLEAFLATTKLKDLSVFQGALMTSAISKASAGSTSRDYTTGVVGTGDPSLSNPAFEGNVQFSIDAETSLHEAKHIDIDLADMGATPRSLNSVVAFLNQKLQANGLLSSFKLEKLGDKTAEGQDQFALKLSVTTGEGYSFSAPETAPALYVVGGEDQFLKVQDTQSGTAAAPPVSANALSVPGQVFTETLTESAALSNVRASTTGPDGSVYVLADATADLSSQPIKGQNDVALFKYDSTGHLVYSRVLGAAEQSQGFALAVDSATGKVAVAGAVGEQHVVLGAEPLLQAVAEDQNLVAGGKRRRSMRGHDNDASASPNRADRRFQRRVAIGIEVGVGFVENDQKRVAIEGARQGDPLPLPGRQGGTALPDLGVVAERQTKDRFVHSGLFGSADDRHRIRLPLHAGDILGHGSVEEFDGLRNVSDVAAEVGAPVITAPAALLAQSGESPDDLRRQADNFIDLSDLADLIGRPSRLPRFIQESRTSSDRDADTYAED